MYTVLDPGHGGHDPAGKSTPLGHSPPGSRPEKELTLELARCVSAHLPAARLTRQHDGNLSLQGRLSQAQNGARAFVSLHASPGGVDEVWVHPEASGASRTLASTVAQALGGRVRSDAAMAILSPTGLPPGVPAILVEADFHALDRGGTQAKGQAIANGLNTFLGGQAHAGGPLATALVDDDAARAARAVLEFFWPDSGLGLPIRNDHLDLANVMLQAYLDCRRMTDWIPRLLRGVKRLSPPLIRQFVDFYRRVLEGGLLVAACRNTVAAAYRTARGELVAGLRPTVLGGRHGGQASASALSSYAPGSYGIPRMLVPMSQPDTWLCWATAYAMMIGWRDQISLSPRDAVARVGQEWAQRLDNNQGLPWADYRRFASAAGLRLMEPQSMAIEGWLDKFQQVDGPIWVAHIPGGSATAGGHVWVLEGIEYDGTLAGSVMVLVDPAVGARVRRPFLEFLPEYEQRFIRSGQAHVLHF